MSKSAAVARPRHMLTGVTSPAAATRGLKDSPLQRVSEIVLIVGTVLAAAAASGSIWVVRLGVAVAIATALASCAFAWRALNTARRTHAQAMLKATREHGEVLTEERTRNAAVIGIAGGGFPGNEREQGGLCCDCHFYRVRQARNIAQH